MNKNLKKVISSVAALALSASAVSAFAVDFPDVAADANYAQAVQELSALNVINGYEDGTFRPDELVTRAEITKMIVDALAETEQAEASKVNTKFADVSADHWAKGYINQGVADQFISGYSDTEFGPDDKVTYVQAQTMLVSAIGYRTYAEGNGGWPNGYKQWASSQGITDGISGLVDDTQLTRAQVAVLIDNAMDAPVCKIKSWNTEWNGTQTPNLDIMDGEGKDYQTLFTEKHDAYKVYGRVTATSKTVSGLDTDKVMFRVEKADNFDKEYVKASDERDADEMFYGDTNAENMLRTYAQALIQKNDDDEYTILSIVPAAANKTVSLLAEDIDESKSKVAENVLYFFPTGTTRGAIKYQLADSVDLYVNGVEMGTFDDNALQTYIIDNDTAMVTLQKETELGSTSTSSKYNVIMITTYTTAVVDQVVDKSSEVSINFKKYSDSIKTKMTVQKDDDTYKYSFKLNGEEIEPTDLQEFDVLSISYDVGNGSKDAFADSTFYDVIVSRDNTAEGKYTGKNSTGDEFTIGGTKYKAANGISVSFDTSTEYSLYLDAFGRIAYTDEVSDSKKIGILKSVYRKNNGDYAAEIIDKDATVNDNYTMDAEDALAVATKFGGTAKDDSTFDSGLGKTNDDLVQQVVEYKTTTSGKLTIKNYLTGKDDSNTYKATSNKIGAVKISDATSIIDLTSTKKDDYKAMTIDNLKDGNTYTVYGYNKSSSDSTYRFVLVTEGIGGIDSKSQLAVFVESGTDSDEEGNDVDTMTVLVGGEKTTLLVDDEADDVDVAKFAEGDALIYSLNTAGEIDSVLPVFATKGILNDAADYDDFRDGIFADTAILDKDTVAELESIADSDVDEGDVSLAFGAVVKNGNDGYTLAKINTDNGAYVNLADSDNNIDLDIANATIYTYNFNNNKKKGGRLVTDDGMAVTPDVTAAYEGADNSNDTYFLDHEDVIEDVVFAIARTIDGDEVQEIYLIVAE